MLSLAIRFLLAGLSICSFLLIAEDDNGLSAYKSGNFEAAIPLLQNAVSKSPNDALLQAALLSSLVYEGRVDQAFDADEHDATALPDSPEVLAARGEFAFYMGDMPQAEKLFRAAIKIKEATPRAVYGLSRLYRAASFYRAARLACMRARQIDEDDALIMQAWLRYAFPQKRQELLGPFAAAHPWLYKHYDQGRESSAAVRKATENRKIFEPDGPPQPVTLHLLKLLRNPNSPRGVGLELRIDGGRPLRMLFDTGASGIVVKQSAIDKAELEHLGSGESWGIGDKGVRNSFAAVASTCQVSTLKFKTCVIEALEGKGRIAGDEDGLIGADFFSDYVVTLDFEKSLMHLEPLPPRPADPQGYDRSVPPEESQFTPVFRFGHSLLVSTKVNERCTGLFLLDTGAGLSN
nr:aspartyl protease family protein [Acidobacteriota bacterium]